MAQRFSNFEDEEVAVQRATPNKTDSDSAKGSSHGHSTKPEKFRQTNTTDTSFDDFDTDWDSEEPTPPPRARSPATTASSITRPSNARLSTPGSTRGAHTDQGDDNSTFEISRGLDLDRRAFALDNDEEFDRDSKFGTNRTASLAGGALKSPGAMSLNTFRSSRPNREETDNYQPRATSSEPKPSREPSNGEREPKYESSMPPMPQVQYEPFSVEPPSHYQNYLYFRKYIHGLNILCGLHLLYTIIALIFKVWYLIGGVLVAPFGFFAIHRLDRRMILIWGILFAADTLAEAIGALVYSGKAVDQGGGFIVTLTHLAIVVLRGGLTYLIYRFWSKLPENAMEYFALFTSSPEKPDVV